MALVISKFPRSPFMTHADYADSQQQQQPWLLSTTKKSPKHTNNLRFRLLLDNNFSPLSNPRKSHTSNLSASFPSIMPTLKIRSSANAAPAPTNQRGISDFFDKKSHTRITSSSKGSSNSSSGSADGSKRSNSPKSSPTNASPAKSISPKDSPPKETSTIDSPKKASKSPTKHLAASPPKGNPTKAPSPPGLPSKASNNILSSIDQEGSDISNGNDNPGNTNQRKPAGLSSLDDDSLFGTNSDGSGNRQSGTIKDGWDDSDDEDSDLEVSQAVDKAMDSVLKSKGSRKPQRNGDN